MKISKYLFNAFILFIPIILWNIFLFKKLPMALQPDFFNADIPIWLAYSENILRYFVFGLPFFMGISFKHKANKWGLALYVFGVIIYFASWLLQIYFPQSSWSLSAFGFMAPAYTTIVWLVGIAFIGDQFFFKLPKATFIYIFLCVVFAMAHSFHAYLVFLKL